MRTAFVTLTMCLFALPANAKYSGGTGEPNDPYQIATAADLIALGETPEDYDKHFILTADIDLDPNLPGRKVFGKAVIAPDVNAVESGFEGTPFTGVFDGGGYAILHLTIKGGIFLGLFGNLQSEAQVKDLGVIDANIVGSEGRIGALVGSNEGSVTRCYSSGTVHGQRYVGGLVGANYGDITKSHSSVTVSASPPAFSWEATNAGGLVGQSWRGTVTECYAAGAVSGTSNVGGLVGTNGESWESVIKECYSKGQVMGETHIGGLVGVNYANLVNCYSVGLVAGEGCVGGLLGTNNQGYFGTPAGTAVNCYSTGQVLGNEATGGLVGCGGGFSTVEHSFWDMEISGQATSVGGIGLTTAEMQTAQTFLDAGWDLVGETANGTDDIWWIEEDEDYPMLLWESKPPWAFCPEPKDGALDVAQSPVLRWHPGRSAWNHDVYFADDRNSVAYATPGSANIYRGCKPADANMYDPGHLEWNKTYYWRIDEVNQADPNSPWKGAVWSFTTADFLVVSVLDDFESYTDYGNLIFRTWKDGFYEDANNPGNSTGSSVGNWEPPFAEQVIVHGGKQSMPMDYNNVNKPWYSETQRTWDTPQDWTVQGADTLTLYFRGEAENSPEPLHVGIEDSAGQIAVVAHPDAEPVLASEWQKWQIALADVRVAGVDVAAVQKMVIGVGDRNSPKPGGTGRIYIDDIRLTKHMP